jgi:hypothetical protein
MKHQNPLLGGRVVENAVNAVVASHAKLRDAAATVGIGREVGIRNRSPICSRKRPFPRIARVSLGNRRIASLAFGWKMTGRTT